ncbi:SMC-Scp complex subunit ScpB [Corynebacterium liangguodongii]|uniref:SMC-Scp complex subunit ScpB n=1 Tax=Corynebacterium liangguodongii TaxID=2079535 RepID=A0A2S0WDX9_9CORY|nr:SMC-Scp complex subunit ScpB [Corynebacterium liangguodongii]AWB83971.1 SMC-Scp complex subunit ScpB [Corynebacterium liangguodongii]PWB99982.1 SMC-Scp complex subunit ScpB [Corynebacterium liangguodongii]
MEQPDGLPMVTQLRSQLESVLLVIDSPASTADLARALGAEEGDVDKQLREIAAEFDARGSGMSLREGEEGWRLYTRAENSQAVEKFLLDGTQSTLSRAALETLAVIAYRQPVTRSQVAGVRGVNVDGVMRTLALRGLIAEVDPDASTGAHRYVTTEFFLELLGIDSLDSLPELAPLLPEIDSIEDAW